jgi:hypothetical protein
MIQPSTTGRIDLGLILPAATPAAGRLGSAAKFNPLFTHRVRITAATDLDDELRRAVGRPPDSRGAAWTSTPER